LIFCVPTKLSLYQKRISASPVPSSGIMFYVELNISHGSPSNKKHECGGQTFRAPLEANDKSIFGLGFQKKYLARHSPGGEHGIQPQGRKGVVSVPWGYHNKFVKIVKPDPGQQERLIWLDEAWLFSTIKPLKCKVYIFHYVPLL